MNNDFVLVDGLVLEARDLIDFNKRGAHTVTPGRDIIKTASRIGVKGMERLIEIANLLYGNPVYAKILLEKYPVEYEKLHIYRQGI